MLLLTNQRNDLCEYLSVIGHQKIILCPVRGQHLSIFRVSENVLDARNCNNELDRTKSTMGFTTFSVWKTKKNQRSIVVFMRVVQYVCRHLVSVLQLHVCTFLSQVIFIFLLFLGMVMYAYEVETKQK